MAEICITVTYDKVVTKELLIHLGYNKGGVGRHRVEQSTYKKSEDKNDKTPVLDNKVTFDISVMDVVSKLIYEVCLTNIDTFVPSNVEVILKYKSVNIIEHNYYGGLIICDREFKDKLRASVNNICDVYNEIYQND